MLLCSAYQVISFFAGLVFSLFLSFLTPDRVLGNSNILCVCEEDIKRIHWFIHSNNIYKHPLCSLYGSRHWNTKQKISFLPLKTEDRMGRQMGLQTINVPCPLSRWVQRTGGQSDQVR